MMTLAHSSLFALWTVLIAFAGNVVLE